jgi:hypothetical protein
MVPLGLEPDVEMYEAFAVRNSLMAVAARAGPCDFEFDGQFRDFVTDELRQHRFDGPPAGSLLVILHSRPQRARRDPHALGIAIAKIRLDADGRSRKERHSSPLASPASKRQAIFACNA